MPYVHVRPNPFGVLTLLKREYASQNALCLHVPQSHFMSGVHLFCIKVSGKDTTGVSRLACSSLKGGHQTRARGAEIWLMIAYFTEAVAVAAQLAGTTHQGLSQSQCKTNNTNQPGASGCLPAWSNPSTGCVSKVFTCILALLPPMLLYWPENRAKQCSQCLWENNSLVTLL